jgi:hypothetical protein
MSAKSVTINLNPETEALLRKRAAQQGQEIHICSISVASHWLADVLQWDEQEAQEAVQGIQHLIHAHYPSVQSSTDSSEI